MGRLIASVVVALSLWSVTPGRAGEELKHSGRLGQIGPDGQIVTLEEMVTWTGPGTGLTERSIAISPATSVRLIRRTDDANPDGWPGGFTAAPLSHSELRVQDWVTVQAEREGDRLVAVSIEVVRP
jgi:hypothetical protein